MSIAQPRLLAASALVLVLTAATGTVGLAQLRSTARAYDALVDRDAGLTKDLLEMQVAVDDEADGVRGYVLSRGDEALLAAYRRGSQTFAAELEQAEAKLDDAEDFARLEEIRRRHELLIPIYEREIALTRRGRHAAALTMARTDGQRGRQALVRTLNALVSSEAEELYRGRARVSGVQRTSELAILALLVLALLAAGVVASMAVRAARRGAGAEADARRARSAAAEEGAVARIAMAIAHEAEPRAVLEAAAGEAATLLEAASAAIIRFEPTSGAAVVVGSAGEAAPEPGRRIAVAPADVLGECRLSGRSSSDESDGRGPPPSSARKATARWRSSSGWGATRGAPSGSPGTAELRLPRRPTGWSASPSWRPPRSAVPTLARTSLNWRSRTR